jgi:GntR family phosphonate transport system transcriptional regulator
MTKPNGGKSKAGKLRAARPERASSRKQQAGAAWRTASPRGGRTADSSAGIALWRQIAEDIEADIETGRLAGGARMPTEAAMAERFGVNRHTLRRAIAELTSKGLVEASPGRGTFVRAARLAYPIGPSTRFSEIIAGSGQEPGGRLLRYGRVMVPSGIRDWLGLPEDGEVIELEHLRAADSVPICFATTWFPAARLAGIGEAYAVHGTITASLAACGIDSYRRLRTHISCRNANSAERDALELARGANVLVIDSLNVDARGHPIQVSHTRFAADRVRLVVEDEAGQPPRGG